MTTSGSGYNIYQHPPSRNTNISRIITKNILLICAISYADKIKYQKESTVSGKVNR
jgi:hypothetical protein